MPKKPAEFAADAPVPEAAGELIFVPSLGTSVPASLLERVLADKPE
jgi:hypothetical protein